MVQFALSSFSLFILVALIEGVPHNIDTLQGVALHLCLLVYETHEHPVNLMINHEFLRFNIGS